MHPTAKPGMSLNVKIGIAVVPIVALVFVWTLLKMLPTGGDDTGNNNTGQTETPKQGITQFVTLLHYQPDAPRAEYREYQQYFETGEYSMPFLMCNSNEVPLTVSFTYTSCTACSLAEFAILPSLPFNPQADPDPFGAVIGGVTGKVDLLAPLENPPFGLNDVSYRTMKRIEAEIPQANWKRLKPPGSTRDDFVPDKAVEIPAAGPGKPTWVIARLNIKVAAAKTLETHFSCQRPDSTVPLPFALSAVVAPVEPCEVYPPTVDFKTMTEDVRSAEETIYYWSHTRTLTGSAELSKLPPPDVAAVRVPNVSFTPPVPATRDELEALAKRLAPDPKTPPVRVAAAYKTTLRFNRTATTADGKTTEADLGPYERIVDLPPDGRGLTLTKTPSVTVKANLLGSVRLFEGGQNVKDDKINLGSFNVRTELVRDIVLTSDKPGLELEAVPEMTEPKYLRLDPEIKTERKGDHTRWTITLRIDKGVGGGEMKPGSVVVMRIKSTGQLIRIPVVGRGTS